MRFQIVENGVVINTVTADEAPAFAVGWIANETAGIGDIYDAQSGTFSAPAAPPPDPRLWWVNVGPFKDRFGVDAMAIAASSHDTCRAVIEMLNGRVYVDLKSERVASLLDVLIAANEPAANAFFPGSGPMTTAKKAVILDTPTVEEERYVKGLK